MGFHNFMGNTPILKSIQQQLSEGKNLSSFLFSGISGIGKWTLAHYISKALNCKKLSNDFCDSCTSCLKINKNIHLDVKTYSPDGTFIKINHKPYFRFSRLKNYWDGSINSFHILN